MEEALLYAEVAGTELETGPETAAAETEAEEMDFLESEVDMRVLGSGGGKEPPERKDGHKERSSGREED